MAAAQRIVLGDDADAWRALGLAIAGGACRVGALELGFTGEGGGIVRVEVDAPTTAPEGLPIAAGAPARAALPSAHPNGAVAVDHLVVVTPARDTTAVALAAVGGDLRRTGGPPALPAPMAFLRFGALVVEVVEDARATAPAFWGLTLEVEDLDRVAARLGGALGPVRTAVQPGRRIATVRRAAGLGAPVALLDRRG